MGKEFMRREVKRYGPARHNLPDECAMLLAVGSSGIVGVFSQSVVLAFATLFFAGGLILWTTRNNAAKPEASATETSDGVKPSTLPADEVLRLIKQRRSIFPKDFNGEKVPRSVLGKMFDAANWAPTHGRTEPWRFVVFEGLAKLDLLNLFISVTESKLEGEKREKALAKLHSKKEKDAKVSAYIAICMKRAAKPDKVMPEWEEIAAVSSAVQNLSLAATALGVAGYWTSGQELARESAEMKALLGLDPEDKCLGFWIAGYSDKVDSYRSTRGAWEEKVTWKS